MRGFQPTYPHRIRVTHTCVPGWSWTSPETQLQRNPHAADVASRGARLMIDARGPLPRTAGAVGSYRYAAEELPVAVSDDERRGKPVVACVGGRR